MQSDHGIYTPQPSPTSPPLDTIDYIQLSVLSEEEWRKLAVCTVTKSASYQSAMKSSKEGTLFDERMGSIAPGGTCQTCHALEIQCPGHFGLIELPVPVINKLFKDYILKLLRSTCMECGRLRLHPDQLASTNALPKDCEGRLDVIHDKCKDLTECAWPDCKRMLPHIDYDENMSQFMCYYDDAKDAIHLTSQDILNQFKKMDSSTIDFLRFNTWIQRRPSLYKHQGKKRIHRHEFRPESMIFTVLPVIPPCARPYVVRNGQICDDDLVDQYNTILKDCEKVSNAKPNTPERNTFITNLHRNVWSIVQQEFKPTGKSQINNRNRKTLKARIVGKEGRVLGNIVGKRVNFTSRGVIISGGLLLKDNELGVPEYVAQRQTVPEPVLPWNIHKLNEFLKQGKIVRVNRHGRPIRLDAMEGRGIHFNLREGDIVERHIQDGDDILFNRQPSIRLEAFEHFKVKIVPGYAFRLGLTYVTAFNADQPIIKVSNRETEKVVTP